MKFLLRETLKTSTQRLASLSSRACLPPILLLLALSSAFIFGSAQRGNFYRDINHNSMSAKNLAVAENLSPEHQFLMFRKQVLDADGKHAYEVYNRFPIGGYALIKLAILPFGDDLSAKIYAARMLMLLFFAAAAVLAYLSLARIASNPWIALTATLLAFSSAYGLYYSDMISNEAVIDLFGVMLAFHGMAIFEHERRFRQLIIKACVALLLGWHVYALLLPFIVLGLTRELIKARPDLSTSSLALRQLKHTTLSLLRSRYLTLGVVTLLFGISILAFNFTNEYFALNRETSLKELPSFRSMLNRTGVDPHSSEHYTRHLPWPGFLERQFYRVGMTPLPYALSLSFVEHMSETARLFVILGIAVSGVSLIGLLLIRQNKILLATLALSGFFWALPMRHNTAYPWHSFEAVFYIGVALTLFSLALLYLRRLSGDRLIATLSAVALLAFALSALRMSQLNSPDQTDEFNKTAIADFEVIRNMTDGKSIQINSNIRDYDRHMRDYYFAGRTIMRMRGAGLSAARLPDFVVTDMRVDGLASLTQHNRMLFLYEGDDFHRRIDEIIEQAAYPLIHSEFEVYFKGNALIYVKDNCREDDLNKEFFLAVYPVDENDLSDERRRHGFDNLDFDFEEQAVRRSKRCIARTPLPEYDIARIKTGQFIQRADGSFENLWEGDARLAE